MSTRIVSKEITTDTDERDLYPINPLTGRTEDGEFLSDDEIQTLMGEDFKDEMCPEGESCEDLKGLSISTAKNTRERVRLGFSFNETEENMPTLRDAKGKPIESPSKLFGFHLKGRDVAKIDGKEHFVPSKKGQSFVMLDSEERKQISPDTAMRVRKVTKIRSACANAIQKES